MHLDICLVKSDKTNTVVTICGNHNRKICKWLPCTLHSYKEGKNSMTYGDLDIRDMVTTPKKPAQSQARVQHLRKKIS